MKIVGLDLSLTQSGYASANGGPRRMGVITTKKQGMPRLQEIRDRILDLVRGADLVVLEGYSFGQMPGSSQSHSAGELGGVIRLALFEAGIPYVEIAPTKLKKFATGSGKGKKLGVLVAAGKRLGYEGDNDNEADALWLLELGLQRYELSQRVLPTVHMEALNGVPWPNLTRA